MKTKNKHTEDLRSYFYQQLQKHEIVVVETVFNNKTFETDSDENTETAEYAISNGVGSLLHNSETFKYLNEDNRKAIKKAYLTTLVNNTHRWQIIEKIKKTYDDAGINHLFLKGSLLAYTCYTDAALRPMSDIDFLVNESDAEKAFTLLRNNGAKGTDFPSYLSDTDHHLPPLMMDNIMIEVHRMVFPVNAKFNIDNDTLFGSKTLWGYNNITLPGPNHYLTAFYVSTHLYYTYMRGGCRLSWFYDIHTLADKISKYDKEILYKSASQHNLLEPLTFTHTIYYLLTGNQIPNWPVEPKFIPDKKTIKRIVQALRKNSGNHNAEGYRLIIEQIKQAENFKTKWIIIKDRLTSNYTLNGWKLVKHILLVIIRSFQYFTRKN